MEARSASCVALGTRAAVTLVIARVGTRQALLRLADIANVPAND
jgi:hypothetical protein